MQEFFQILSNFGFPIALSCYLLFRFEKVLQSLQKTITDLVETNKDLVIKNTELVNKNTEQLTEIKLIKENVKALRGLLGRRKS